jgi:predicted amidohydrolase
MQPIKIATAQFENRNNDKAYNLGIIRALAAEAKAQDAQAIAFHECSITGYSFARHLDKAQLTAVAELIPDGESVQALITIARELDIVILAGLFEKTPDGTLYKAYVCVDKTGLLAKYRKLHPFINPHLTPGDSFAVFDLLGWKCGILICYDNNIIENVRATTLLGADIIFMPHVTMCTPSPRPGAGFVDPRLWTAREEDPTTLRAEFDGLKGRSWLMKWLPARAYDNGVYVVFANAIGMDDDQLKNGSSMIIDPFGDVITECRKLGDDFAMATLIPQKLIQSGAYRYKNARRPELYGAILSAPHAGVQKVAWMKEE